jgi:hypothetical protein
MSNIKLLVIKEEKRADEAFLAIKVKDNSKAKDLFKLAKSYYKDAKHFQEKGLLLEAFELYSYLWGLLDAGARLGLFDPGIARKHFKVEQD